jgi:hypothetical protein
MKDKLMFGLQVFTTLILIMAIFVTYLERGEVNNNHQIEDDKIFKTEISGTEDLAGLLNTSFTTTLTGVISCGK